jgi:hypothetical protein
MAHRKVTFSLPEEILQQLVRRVAARDRSRYVAEAIAAKLRERERRLIRSCEAANADPEVLVIEGEWAAQPDDIAEPWSDAPAR